MRKPILILSAAPNEDFDQFVKRMKGELLAVAKTRKKNIVAYVSRKTMKAYFYNGEEAK